MGTRQLPASVSVNSAILTIFRTFKWQKKEIFSYLSLWAFYLVTGEALPPLTACHWLSGSYSRHAEFGDLVHLFPNLFCVCRLKCFFDFQSHWSHGEFISVHVLPLLPGVQHPGRGARASVDLHIRRGTAWHIWRHDWNSSSAANSGKYRTRSLFLSLWSECRIWSCVAKWITSIWFWWFVLFCFT